MPMSSLQCGKTRKNLLRYPEWWIVHLYSPHKESYLPPRCPSFLDTRRRETDARLSAMEPPSPHDKLSPPCYDLSVPSPSHALCCSTRVDHPFSCSGINFHPDFTSPGKVSIKQVMPLSMIYSPFLIKRSFKPRSLSNFVATP